MVFKALLLPQQRAFAAYLRPEKKNTLRQSAVRASMSNSSVFRIVHGRRTEKIRKRKGQHRKSGRQKTVLSRFRRKLCRSLQEENLNFTIMDVVKRSGIPQHKANYRTFQREIRNTDQVERKVYLGRMA